MLSYSKYKLIKVFIKFLLFFFLINITLWFEETSNTKHDENNKNIINNNIYDEEEISIIKDISNKYKTIINNIYELEKINIIENILIEIFKRNNSYFMESYNLEYIDENIIIDSNYITNKQCNDFLDKKNIYKCQILKELIWIVKDKENKIIESKKNEDILLKKISDDIHIINLINTWSIIDSWSVINSWNIINTWGVIDNNWINDFSNSLKDDLDKNLDNEEDTNYIDYWILSNILTNNQEVITTFRYWKNNWLHNVISLPKWKYNILKDIWVEDNFDILVINTINNLECWDEKWNCVSSWWWNIWYYQINFIHKELFNKSKKLLRDWDYENLYKEQSIWTYNNIKNSKNICEKRKSNENSFFRCLLENHNRNNKIIAWWMKFKEFYWYKWLEIKKEIDSINSKDIWK